MVRLFVRPDLPAFTAIVGPFAWGPQLTSGVPFGAWLGRWGFGLTAAAQKDGQQLKRIHIQCAGNRNKFYDVESTLTTFVFSNKGLWFLQAKGEGLLGQPGGLARPNHKLAKGGLVGRMDRFTDSTAV